MEYGDGLKLKRRRYRAEDVYAYEHHQIERAGRRGKREGGRVVTLLKSKYGVYNVDRDFITPAPESRIRWLEESEARRLLLVTPDDFLCLIGLGLLRGQFVLSALLHMTST